MTRRLERLAQRTGDQIAHAAGIAKAHLRLGRMDVDVDLARVAFDEEGRDSMPVGGKDIEIGPAQRSP